jgi:hypothetical protein
MRLTPKIMILINRSYVDKNKYKYYPVGVKTYVLSIITIFSQAQSRETIPLKRGEKEENEES